MSHIQKYALGSCVIYQYTRYGTHIHAHGSCLIYRDMSRVIATYIKTSTHGSFLVFQHTRYGTHIHTWFISHISTHPHVGHVRHIITRIMSHISRQEGFHTATNFHTHQHVSHVTYINTWVMSHGTSPTNCAVGFPNFVAFTLRAWRLRTYLVCTKPFHFMHFFFGGLASPVSYAISRPMCALHVNPCARHIVDSWRCIPVIADCHSLCCWGSSSFFRAFFLGTTSFLYPPAPLPFPVLLPLLN